MANWFFKLALVDRNMNHLKVVLKSLDLRNFASTTIFYEILICKHADLFFGKKILNVTTVKLFLFLKKINVLGFFDAFLFQPSIKGKKLSIS